MKANGETAPHHLRDVGNLWLAYPDATSAVCAKLTANVSHQQWRDWVSPDIDYFEACPGLPVAPDAAH